MEWPKSFSLSGIRSKTGKKVTCDVTYILCEQAEVCGYDYAVYDAKDWFQTGHGKGYTSYLAIGGKLFGPYSEEQLNHVIKELERMLSSTSMVNIAPRVATSVAPPTT
jgi:hypothetical protein